MASLCTDDPLRGLRWARVHGPPSAQLPPREQPSTTGSQWGGGRAAAAASHAGGGDRRAHLAAHPGTPHTLLCMAWLDSPPRPRQRPGKCHHPPSEAVISGRIGRAGMQGVRPPPPSPCGGRRSGPTPASCPRSVDQGPGLAHGLHDPRSSRVARNGLNTTASRGVWPC